MRRVAWALLAAIACFEVLLLAPAYLYEETSHIESLKREVRAVVETAIHPFAGQIAQGDYENAIEALTHTPHSSHILGGGVYDVDGTLIRRFGEPLYFEAAELSRPRTDLPGGRLEFLISEDVLDAPVRVAIRADTSWIPAHTSAFLWQVLAIVLILSVLVCAAATLVITHLIVEPLLELRASLVAAGNDPTNASEFAPPRRGFGVLGDITRIIQQLLQRVSQTFREELMSFAAMIEHTGDAVLAYDGDGVLVYANKACLNYCGVASLRELKAHGGPRFQLTETGEICRLNELLETDSFSGELDLVFPDRKPLRCLISAARLRTDDGGVLRTFASLSDISIIREAQWVMEQKNIELEEANRIKAEFLAKMSHELRTPLNAIIGFSEILSARPQSDDDDVHTFAADINNSGHHLLGLINDILDLSKLEAGKQELNESNVDLSDLAKSACDMLRETARKNGIRLVCDLPERPLVIKGDEIRMKQILLNLLSNAIKFTPEEGQVTLKVAKIQDHVEVKVTDTGIGMKPEDIPKAVQPFAQIDSGPSRRFEGTGLGLPICSSLVELHGGNLDIQSTEGEGTTVSFSLPASRVVSAAA